MRIETAHVHVTAPADDVFRYLADVVNLPEWSTEFVQKHRLEGDALRATTGAGDVTIRTRPDNATRVVDILVQPDGRGEALFPTRIVPLPDGTSVFAFTMFQAPDQSAASFESDLASLRRELENIRKRFAG